MRIYMTLLGIIISSVSIFNILLFTSILNSGFSYGYFFKYLFTHFETYLLFIGIFLIYFSLEKGRD